MNLNATVFNHLCYRNKRLGGLEMLLNLSRSQFPQWYKDSSGRRFICKVDVGIK